MANDSCHGGAFRQAGFGATGRQVRKDQGRDIIAIVTCNCGIENVGRTMSHKRGAK